MFHTCTRIRPVRANFKQLYLHTPIENWTHVYMNLFTRKSPYYHLLKYPVYSLSVVSAPDYDNWPVIILTLGVSILARLIP